MVKAVFFCVSAFLFVPLYWDDKSILVDGVVGAALIISIRVCFVAICTGGRCICFLFLYFCVPPYWGDRLVLLAGVVSGWRRPEYLYQNLFCISLVADVFVLYFWISVLLLIEETDLYWWQGWWVGGTQGASTATVLQVKRHHHHNG